MISELWPYQRSINDPEEPQFYCRFHLNLYGPQDDRYQAMPILSFENSTKERAHCAYQIQSLTLETQPSPYHFTMDLVFRNNTGGFGCQITSDLVEITGCCALGLYEYNRNYVIEIVKRKRKLVLLVDGMAHKIYRIRSHRASLLFDGPVFIAKFNGIISNLQNFPHPPCCLAQTRYQKTNCLNNLVEMSGGQLSNTNADVIQSVASGLVNSMSVIDTSNNNNTSIPVNVKTKVKASKQEARPKSSSKLRNKFLATGEGILIVKDKENTSANDIDNLVDETYNSLEKDIIDNNEFLELDYRFSDNKIEDPFDSPEVDKNVSKMITNSEEKEDDLGWLDQFKNSNIWNWTRYFLIAVFILLILGLIWRLFKLFGQVTEKVTQSVGEVVREVGSRTATKTPRYTGYSSY